MEIETLVNTFVSSTKNIITQMTGIDIEISPADCAKSRFVSLGVASIITFVGQIRGRLILDIEESLAKAMITNIMGKEIDSVEDENLILGIQEINNTIAGDAVTSINNSYKAGIRTSPPMGFVGDNICFTCSKLVGREVSFNSEQGNLKIYVSFDGLS